MGGGIHAEETNLKTKLALGTAQFGLPYGIANRTGQIDRVEAATIIRMASQHRIDAIDTAIAYGESEACLGAVGMEGFKVVTKLSELPAGVADVGAWVHDQVEGSLRRLGISQLYGLLLHRPQQLYGPSSKPLKRALKQLRGEGIVAKIGISVYSPSELDALGTNFTPDIVQAPLNLIDRRMLSSGWLMRLKRGGVEIHARSVFLQGLLLIACEAIPKKFARWNNLLQAWHSWLACHPGTSAARACLAFALSIPEVDRVVVGVDNAIQLEQLISSTQNIMVAQWPDIECCDENLINPSKWSFL